MDENRKTKEQLTQELENLHRRIAEFEKSETGRKRAEEALRESENRFRLITETIEEVFWMADIEIQKMFYISPGYERIWGRSQQSLYDNPKSFLDSIHPEDQARVLADLEVQKSGQPFDHEYRIIRPDGSIRWIWDRGFPVKSETGPVSIYVGVANDITERQQAEEVLRESEERYRTVIEQSNDGVVLVKGDQHIFVNQKMLEIFGYDRPEEIVGKPAVMIVHPDDQKRVEDINRRRQKGEAVPNKYEVKGQRKNGEPIYIEVSAAKITYQGEAISLVNLRDITERKQAEEAIQQAYDKLEQRVAERTEELRQVNAGLQSEITERKRTEEKLKESEARYRLLAENASDVIWTVNMENELTYVSPSVTRVTGYTVEEAKARTMKDAFTPASYEVALREFVKALDLEKDGKYGSSQQQILEIALNHKDGTIVPAEGNFTFLRDSTGNSIGVLAIVRDITERKRAEEEKKLLETQIWQARKAESLGRMAGAIAHQYNNS